MEVILYGGFSLLSVQVRFASAPLAEHPFQAALRFPQLLHGLDLLTHGAQLLILQILLCVQNLGFTSPLFRRDGFAPGFEIFQIPNGGVIQGKLGMVTLFKLLLLGWLHLDILAVDGLVFFVLLEHGQPFFQHRNAAFGGHNFATQIVIPTVHAVHLFVELLHGGDAVGGKQAEQRRLFPQLLDRAIAGGRLAAHRLLCLLKLGYGWLAALWLGGFAFRPAVQPGNAGFDLFEQLIVGVDLAVQIALAGGDAALFHLCGGNTQMHRGDFFNALPLIAAMVDPLRPPGSFQRLIGIGRPCAAPVFRLLPAVPVSRVLPMIFPAALAVRDTLATLVQIIDLAALRAPLPVFFQWADSQQNVGVRVAGFAVVDGKISAHPFVNKIIFYIRADEG